MKARGFLPKGTVTEPGSGKGRFSPTASFAGSGLQFVQLINRRSRDCSMKMNTLLTGNSMTTNIKTYGELAMKIMRSFERFWVTSRLSTICLIAISLLFTSQVSASTDGEVSGRRVTLYVASGTFGAQGTLYTIDPQTVEAEKRLYSKATE